MLVWSWSESDFIGFSIFDASYPIADTSISSKAGALEKVTSKNYFVKSFESYATWLSFVIKQTGVSKIFKTFSPKVSGWNTFKHFLSIERYFSKALSSENAFGLAS